MTHDAASNETRYNQFIEEVVATGTVWGLSKDDAWATSSSADYEDEDVILFWSDEDSAKACAEDDWATYQTESVTLMDFLENWCVGMYGDELILGTNWTPDLSGKEVDPLIVALDIVNLLKERGETLEFTQYDNQEEFEKQLIEALEGEED
ncbi:DUF2750 domain-containing protein [Pontibacter sp. 13R65]|uniref:DUF2750 domain-containing protein n=1 Tax=Pontibacter sp. 13R65 TaxID=3127458 RepID=UPI00301D3412